MIFYILQDNMGILLKHLHYSELTVSALYDSFPIPCNIVCV